MPLIPLLLLLAGAPSPARPAGAPAVKQLTGPQAIALLQKPAALDAASSRVLQRVALAYSRLKSLESVTLTPEVKAIARLKRPRYYHYLQAKPEGELIALAISDGRRYYEYSERTRQYRERDAAFLNRVTLPANVRMFFPGQTAGAPMVGLDGEPAVRDYAFRYLGREKVRGKPADVLSVSTMLRSGRDTWVSYDNKRYYDAATGLLVRMVNGARVTDIQNRVNLNMPTEGFRWKPIPGALKGFG